MIEQFYLDLYPVLTQDWRQLGQCFGSINYDMGVETSHRDLSARVYIFVGNKWSKVCLEVRHRLHGTATYNLGHAKQPAQYVWRSAAAALPGLEADVLRQFEAWASELERKVTQAQQEPTHG